MYLRLLLRVACLCLLAVPAAGGAQARYSAAVAQAAKAACGKQVVLIGEADHGDGATVQFKAELVERLVSKCGFNAVYFEIGSYDFLKVEEMVRAHRPIDAPMLASSIGALWNRDAELAPLVHFLLPRVNSGTLLVGGIDDQIGALGAFYSLDQMETDLASVLPEPRRSDCREQMRRRANYDYSNDHPHDAAAIAHLDRCLAEIQERLRSGRSDPLAENRLQMATEFRHSIARDFLPVADLILDRDRRMYENFRWLMRRAGPHRKVILWCATAHAAKGTAVSSDYDHGPNLGTLVGQEYGARAFSIGISAAGGAHYWSRSEPSRPIPQAAPGSVEGLALAGSNADAIFVPARQLRKDGRLAGSFNLHEPRVEHWDRLLDGAVILRAERPPVRIP